MQKMSTVDWIAVVLVIVGGLNWGLVGLFGYNLVENIFGDETQVLTRVIYILVGLSALWMIYTGMKMNKSA